MANLRRFSALRGRVAQRESARFTRGRSLVRSQPRPHQKALETGPFSFPGLLQETVRGPFCKAFAKGSALSDRAGKLR